jgi:hypothetical protein
MGLNMSFNMGYGLDQGLIGFNRYEYGLQGLIGI